MTLQANILADLDTIYEDEGGPAQDATLHVSGKASASVRVIFVEPYEVVEPVSGEVMTTAPQCSIRDNESAGMAHGDTITIPATGGTEYAVLEVKPSGIGAKTMTLTKDDPHG